MSVFAISDLHLSFAHPKPMDIFGDTWLNHAERIETGWRSVVVDSDIVLMPGDLSWAIRLDDVAPDLQFVASLPGRKVLVRGNHDFWWSRSMTRRIQEMYPSGFTFLQGTSIVYNGIGITGTRGWRDESEQIQGDVDKLIQTDRILNRELAYLENGLNSIPGSAQMKITMLHYPPFNEDFTLNEFGLMLKKHLVDVVVCGHIHLGTGKWFDGEIDGIKFHTVSADIIDFTPKLIVP
ncbi:MAG: metallophosphoesterase [Armatimonadota bacterium]